MNGRGARSLRAHFWQVLISPDKGINDRRDPGMSEMVPEPRERPPVVLWDSCVLESVPL